MKRTPILLCSIIHDFKTSSVVKLKVTQAQNLDLFFNFNNGIKAMPSTSLVINSDRSKRGRILNKRCDHDSTLIKNGKNGKSFRNFLTPDFITTYKETPVENRCRNLMEKFDEIWEYFEGNETNERFSPSTIASEIRAFLGNAAPPHVKGNPTLPIPVGFQCHYKAQLSLIGLHSQPSKGISTSGSVAMSIVVNGGYADDIDRGSVFIYVGEGGEDSGKCQTLERGNQGLLRACQEGVPLRVVRGYKAHSRYAPAWGFRYDGLYSILTAYSDIGYQDRRVWKFVLQAVDTSFIPPSCGCSITKIMNHTIDRKISFSSEFVPTVNGKVIQKALDNVKDHMKAQSSDFVEPTRTILVYTTQGKPQNFKIKVSQFVLTVPRNSTRKRKLNDGKTNSTTTDLENKLSLRRSEQYRLPTFKSFLSPLKKCPDNFWIHNILPLRSLPNSDSSKPAWAKYGFLPFVLRLTKKTNGVEQIFTLPISKELGFEYALQYFPQSTRDDIAVEIDLRPPFDEKFNPWRDISQGVEERPIPCYNDIDSTPPPTDFSYIKRTIAFCEPTVNLSDVCSGCIPSQVDTENWIEIPAKKSQCCRGLMDPVTKRIYCCGINKNDFHHGDCNSSLCPCNIKYCTNRMWKEGMQWKVSVKRFQGMGYGVIAEEKIPANSFIIEYAGDVIHFGELMARVHKYESNGKRNFCFAIYDEDDDAELPCLDSLYFGNVSRFLNHSCNPNCMPRAHFHNDNGGRGLSLFSIRDIEIGEQMTYDYGIHYTEGLECLCGATNCRKYFRKNEQEDSEGKRKKRKTNN